MKRTLGFVLDGSLLALVTFLSLRPGGVVREPLDSWAAERTLTNEARANWLLLTANSQRLGSAALDAPLIVEFGDYACPYCAQNQPVLDSLLEAHPDVALVYRHVPTNGISRSAAVAAVCASEQGSFSPMHRLLYTAASWDGDAPTNADWRRMAEEVGVGDTTAFVACLDAPRAHAKVDVDLLLAERIGLYATPTYITRNGVLGGVQDLAALRSALDLEDKP